MRSVCVRVKFENPSRQLRKSASGAGGTVAARYSSQEKKTCSCKSLEILWPGWKFCVSHLFSHFFDRHKWEGLRRWSNMYVHDGITSDETFPMVIFSWDYLIVLPLYSACTNVLSESGPERYALAHLFLPIYARILSSAYLMLDSLCPLLINISRVKRTTCYNSSKPRE